MVSQHAQKGNVDAADHVLEVVERQVAARHHQVGPERIELVAKDGFVYLIRDGEDLQFARSSGEDLAPRRQPLDLVSASGLKTVRAPGLQAARDVRRARQPR